MSGEDENRLGTSVARAKADWPAMRDRKAERMSGPALPVEEQMAAVWRAGGTQEPA